MFSLASFFNFFLLFTASLRKKKAYKRVTFIIWTAYLLADWAASFGKFGISVLKEPNPGPNYEKLMRAYSTFEEMGLPTNFECLEDE